MSAARPPANDRTPDRRLRVGYVSPHFYEHAVNFFTEPILASHDHADYEVFCYANSRKVDATTQRLDIVLDPRVSAQEGQLETLLIFQREVATVLARAVAIVDAMDAGEDVANTDPGVDEAREVAEALTALAIDLEHADAAPTTSQRDVLDYERARLNE